MGTILSTIAGEGNAGFKDGTGLSAQINTTSGLAIDTEGNLYVADTQNHSIRKVTPNGMVTTLAGKGFPGYNVGTGANAAFRHPNGVTVDKQGKCLCCGLF